jgi:hypothetical protein
MNKVPETRRFMACYCHVTNQFLGYEDMDQPRQKTPFHMLREAEQETKERVNIKEHEGSKYIRTIVSAVDGISRVEVDVYSVLVAFNVTCPATAHAIKKLLCAGIRGKGDIKADLNGVLAAVHRAIDLTEERERAQVASNA